VPIRCSRLLGSCRRLGPTQRQTLVQSNYTFLGGRQLQEQKVEQCNNREPCRPKGIGQWEQWHLKRRHSDRTGKQRRPRHGSRGIGISAPARRHGRGLRAAPPSAPSPRLSPSVGTPACDAMCRPPAPPLGIAVEAVRRLTSHHTHAMAARVIRCAPYPASGTRRRASSALQRLGHLDS
jgi:hypothetical protein